MSRKLLHLSSSLSTFSTFRRALMKITYDPSVDALYIRLIEEDLECRVIRLNDQVAVDIGPGEQVVGIEVLDASDLLTGLREGKVKLENLTPA